MPMQFRENSTRSRSDSRCPKKTQQQCLVTAVVVELRISVGSHVPYRAVLGYLRYLMTATRPDITLAVSRAGRAMDRTTETDWIDDKHILKYLWGTTTIVCSRGLVTVGEVRRVQRRQLCRRRQNKPVSERRCGLRMQAVQLHGPANCNIR